MDLNYLNFEKNLEKNFLYENKPKIAVGVSGGPDSLLLAIILNKWIKKRKGKIISLIVDHGIRLESRAESINTKKYLTSKKIRSKILLVPKNKIREGKLSQARENRFEQLIKYCQKNNIFYLFLGHHYDDNLETFMLRKIAGSNLEGLNCIQFITIMKNIQIIRPFIKYSKKAILKYSNKSNLTYIEDPSNNDIKYSRVAVRKYLSLNQFKSKVINAEFLLVRKNYNLYIKMIYQILNLITIEANFRKLILNTKKFFCLNSELRVKILSIGMQFVHNSRINIRTKKIEDLIAKMSIHENISLKSNQTLITKLNNKIVIT